MDYVEATCPSCKRLISIDTSALMLTCANCHKALRLVRGRGTYLLELLGEAETKFPWDRPKGLWGDLVIKPIIPPLDPMGASRLPQIPSILPDEPLSRSGIAEVLPVPQVITGALCGYS